MSSHLLIAVPRNTHAVATYAHPTCPRAEYTASTLETSVGPLSLGPGDRVVLDKDDYVVLYKPRGGYTVSIDKDTGKCHIEGFVKIFVLNGSWKRDSGKQ